MPGTRSTDCRASRNPTERSPFQGSEYSWNEATHLVGQQCLRHCNPRFHRRTLRARRQTYSSHWNQERRNRPQSAVPPRRARHGSSYYDRNSGNRGEFLHRRLGQPDLRLCGGQSLRLPRRTRVLAGTDPGSRLRSQINCFARALLM